MSNLMLAIYEDNKFRMNNFRLSPLITWLQFFNFITIAVVCLLFLKIYKSLVHLFEWLCSFDGISETPVILIMGPNNEIVQEMVCQLSKKFDSEITNYQDINDNYSVIREDQVKNKKSQIILNYKSVNSQTEVIEFSKYIRGTYGFVDILVIVRNDDPVESSNPTFFLTNLNKQLLSQFWTVMAFLPTMMRRNSGRIISIALGKSSATNTGIIRTIHEDILKSDTKVKLTLVERNTLLNFYYSCLPTDILVRLILRFMWKPNAVIKVPSLFCLFLLPPLLFSKFILRPASKLIKIILSTVTIISHLGNVEGVIRKWRRSVKITSLVKNP